MILEAYKELKADEVAAFAIAYYTDVDCDSEAERILNRGIQDLDFERIGFEEDTCCEDIDIVLEENEYVYLRDSVGEIVNSSQIYLFSKEW